MNWTHAYDDANVLFKWVEWRLSQILPSIFQKNNLRKINGRLEAIGKNTELVSNEVEAAVDSSIGLFESFFHKCLKWILLVIIIVGGAYLIYRATYVPGTLYGSIKISDVS